MPPEFRETPRADVERVIPLLLLAEPSPRALRWSLGHLSDAVYEMTLDGRVVGAATVRWEGDPCEIVELGVAESEQGKGLGQRFVAWLLGEARRRGKQAMEVGTPNASLGNIAFYQRIGSPRYARAASSANSTSECDLANGPAPPCSAGAPVVTDWLRVRADTAPSTRGVSSRTPFEAARSASV